jgi:hypothetical protein
MTITNIKILKEAGIDLKIGQNFYESQNQGLGNYFKDSIVSDIESLYLYGGIHSKVYGVYRLLSKRFPYGIYYDVIMNTQYINSYTKNLNKKENK